MRNVGGYFMEEVRRILIERHGETAILTCWDSDAAIRALRAGVA